jgi:hypothetical protein
LNNMLNRFNPYSRQRKISTLVNTKSQENSDLTGSLLNIEIPSETTFVSNTRKSFKSSLVNKTNLTETDITGSLIEITEPTKMVNSNLRESPKTPSIVNSDKIVNDFRESILKYSARSIEKQITGFNSNANQLFISGTIIDYGTEAVSDKDFQIYYNGVRLPDIFMVEQINNDIIITLNEEHIEYETLSLSEIKVIGKFI